MLAAPIESYLPIDKTLIPTGELAPVSGTPFDFNEPTAVGARIAQVEDGYDHNLVVNREPGSADLEFVCEYELDLLWHWRIIVTYVCGRLSDPKSGRSMQVFTTEPAVQFYTGGFLDGSIQGKGGVVCAV